MEDQAVRGVRWTVLAYAMSRLVGLVSTSILARLLVPSDFGVVVLATVVIEVTSYFTGLGLGPALVIRQDLAKENLGTAYSLVVLTNIGTAVVVACLAPATGGFLHDARAVPVTLALAAPLFISGVGAFYGSLLQRELLFRPLFIARGAHSLASMIVSVVLAAAGAGVWSLVVGRVVGELAVTLVLTAAAPYRVRPRWDPPVARSLLRSGRGFIAQGVFSFVEQNADYAVVGRTLGSQSLGAYSMGFKISEMPYSAIVEPVSQATFPGFARVRERGEDPSGSFLTLLRLISLCVLPAGMVMLGAARPLVECLLGSKWEPVVAVLPLLALWGSVRALSGTIGWFANSLGYAGRLGASYAVLVMVSVPVLIVAVQHLGIRGAALVMLGNASGSLGIGLSITTRRLGISWRRQWHAVRPAVVAAVPTALAAAAVSALLTGAPSGLQLAGAVAASLSVYALLLSWQDARLIPQAIRQLTRVLRDPARTAAGAQPA